MTLSSETEDLFGGSNKFAWAVEAKTISAEWTASVKSMPDFLFELFLGATVTKEAASATGTINDYKNVKGSSLQEAATGIATVSATVGSEVDLKDGVVILKAVSPTTIDVYYLTDIEFSKIDAAATSYIDDELKVNDTPLTITTGAATAIPTLGLDLNGGSGTIAFTEGDTARLHVNSAHGGVSIIDIGSSSTTFPEHRQLCLGQKRANGDVFEMELYRVVGSGMPIPFEEQAFAVPELAMKLVFDGCNDKVATIRAKRGLGGAC
jgi:hypothetical protein